MSTPTPVVRAVTYERDGHRCVSCGTLEPLQYQHRAASGMGGRLAPPTLPEGVTSCALCNPAYEGHRQAEALFRGWKVRRWVVEQGRAHEVPVWYLLSGWHLLEKGGLRVPLLEVRAVALMRDVYGDEWDQWRAAA